MKLDSDTLQKIKEPILRAELAIAEIMAQYKVTRRQCNEAMYILGVNSSQREAEVRYNKSKAEALARIDDLEAFRDDLFDMTYLNFDLMNKYDITAYTLGFLAEHFGVDLRARKEESKEARSGRYGERKKTDISWVSSSMSGDGESLKWLSMKWK